MDRRASSRSGYVAGHVGRKLFLVDIENYCGRPVLTEEDVAFVKEDLSETCGVSESDLVVIGTSHSSNLLYSEIGWPSARQVIMLGHDGADKALIDVVAEYRIETFVEVVLLSGDGIFSGVVETIRRSGVSVTVSSLARSLSGSLASVATRVHTLSVPSRRRGSVLRKVGWHIINVR